MLIARHLNVATDAPPTHRVNPLYMGCHSDSGFTHQVRGFSSQMIFGESFEAPQANCSKGKSSDAWSSRIDPGVTGAAFYTLHDTVAPAMHGASSRTIVVNGTNPAQAGATPIAALRNRGLGAEGLYFEARKPYEGYFFARCASPVKLVARLEDFTRGDAVLASWTKDFACGGSAAEWVKLDFELTPAVGTSCEGIDVDSDPSVHCTQPTNEAGHSCVRCGGVFSVGLASAGRVDIDYVVLQPGPWGRFKGLNVKKSTVVALQKMGMNAIRVGGSFASVTGWPDGGGGTPPSTESGEYYQWQKWTGPPWLRPSVGAVWNAYNGNSYSLIGGWGPFEVIDLAMAMGIEPLITTTSSSSPDELADLVEYCWADANASALGKKRAADGHPAPYQFRYIELGNEQYNTRFVEQVAAMEERAKALGLGGELRYIFPDNNGLRGGDIDKAKKLGIDNQIAADIHVGPGGAVGVADALFRARPDFAQSAINQETNAGTHTQERALQEATDLNDFFSADASMQRRLLGRTASFCFSRSGHFDAFDQGIASFLPNMTWLQPPGHVHAMIHDTWQPNALNLSSSAADGFAFSPDGFSFSSQRSDDGATVVVRMVNQFAAPIGPNGTAQLAVNVSLGPHTTCAGCALTTLAAADTAAANPSWAPDLVSPQPSACRVAAGGRGAVVPLAPFSFTTLSFSGCKTKTAPSLVELRARGSLRWSF